MAFLLTVVTVPLIEVASIFRGGPTSTSTSSPGSVATRASFVSAPRPARVLLRGDPQKVALVRAMMTRTDIDRDAREQGGTDLLPLDEEDDELEKIAGTANAALPSGKTRRRT